MKKSIRVSTFSKIRVYFVSIPTSYVHYVIFNILRFVSIPTSYVHYVTFNILWFCQYTYLRVTCTTSLLTYCGCVSIITSYVHYVTFKILWFCQYTYELRVLRHFQHTVVLSVYLQVTCTTSLLTYCGFISILTSYVHYVTQHTVVLSVYLPVTCTT